MGIIEEKKKGLLHLHLAVESHAVLVQRMPETKENKSIHKPQSDEVHHLQLSNRSLEDMSEIKRLF